MRCEAEAELAAQRKLAWIKEEISVTERGLRLGPSGLISDLERKEVKKDEVEVLACYVLWLWGLTVRRVQPRLC